MENKSASSSKFGFGFFRNRGKSTGAGNSEKQLIVEAPGAIEKDVQEKAENCEDGGDIIDSPPKTPPATEKSSGYIRTYFNRKSSPTNSGYGFSSYIPYYGSSSSSNSANAAAASPLVKDPVDSKIPAKELQRQSSVGKKIYSRMAFRRKVSSGTYTENEDNEDAASITPQAARDSSVFAVPKESRPLFRKSSKELIPPGSFISTAYGTGTLQEIRKDDGFYIVKLVTNSIGYFHPNAINCEIKARVNERVKTQWGMGTVMGYNVDLDLYEIDLDWRWDDDHVWRIKATVDKFEVSTPMEDSMLRMTCYYLSESISETYASFMESTSSTYASVKKSISKFSKPRWEKPVIENVFTPFGEAKLLVVRPDGVHVARDSNGGVQFLQRSDVIFYQKSSTVGVGTQLNTPYGKGIVLSQRPTDGMFLIQLPWKLSSGKHAILYMCSEAAEACHESGGGRMSSIFQYTKKSMFSGGSLLKGAATGGFTTARQKFHSMTTAGAKSKFNLGERVLTPFGSGYVKAIRFDGGYVVKLRRLQTYAYISDESCSPFPYHLAHYVVETQKQTTKSDPVKKVMRQATGLNKRDLAARITQTKR